MDQKDNQEQRPLEKFPSFEKIIPGSDGWLSPSGVFYKASKDQHNEAADWIVGNNLSELRRDRRPKSDSQYLDESGLPSKQFLYQRGWILINGPIFRTDNALNYTTRQLELLSRAKIPIVGAYDGSKEFSSQETLEWVRDSSERISEYVKSQGCGILVWDPEEGYKPKNVSETAFWENIQSRGFSTLEDFRKDPFHTTFEDFGRVSFVGVRDVLTKGYQDEIVFDEGQETYTLRLIKLESGERICVEYTFHHHVGHGSGNEEHMNVYVVDNFTFKDKINKYLDSGIKARIQGEYFAYLIGDR